MNRAAPLLLLMAACGARTELDVPPEPVCGDGIEQAPEACDLGDANEDRPAILLIHRDVQQRVMPVDRPQDAISFYDYTSESSHTGFEARDLSVLFLYRDTNSERLSLFIHHGIDQDSSGETVEYGLVTMNAWGFPPGTKLALADEPHDLLTFDGLSFEVLWEFWRNTDGVVFEPLPFPGDWTITFTTSFEAGISRWHYMRADGSPVVLSPSDEAILRTYPTPSRCRPDCTIPRCGDGLVDGGEICDDGNVIDGDGCASDCGSL